MATTIIGRIYKLTSTETEKAYIGKYGAAKRTLATTQTKLYNICTRNVPLCHIVRDREVCRFYIRVIF